MSLNARDSPTEGSFSEMVAGVEQRLARDHWFPIQLTSGTIISQGATIELRDGEYLVHEQEKSELAGFPKSDLIQFVP